MTNILKTQPDVVRQIALKLDLGDIKNFCEISKACAMRICWGPEGRRKFWKFRYKMEYPNDNSEPTDDDWQSHYRQSLQVLGVTSDILHHSTMTKGVIMVDAGFRHMGFITIAKNLYLMGSNRFGQLGLARNIRFSDYPILAAKNVSVVRCLSKTTIFINSSDEAFITGELFNQSKYSPIWICPVCQ